MKKYNLTNNIYSVNNLLRRKVEASEQLQKVNRITETNSRIMSYIARNHGEEIFQRDIEKELTITRSTVSRVLSLMESKGLIERHPVARDTRLKQIVLTDDAMKMHVDITSHINSVESQLLDGFNRDEIELVNSFLQRMKENLE